MLAGLIGSLLVANLAVVAFDTTTDPAPPTSADGSGRSERARGKDADRTRGEQTAAGRRTNEARPARSGRPATSLPFEPPAAGVYRYATTSSASGAAESSTEQGTAVYTFGTAKRTGRGLVQVVLIRQSDDDADLRRTNLWSADGIFHLKDGRRGDDGSSSCTYDPPKLVIPFPYRIGDTWSPPQSTCEEGDDSASGGFEPETEENWRVVRKQNVTVGGESVEAVLFEGRMETRFESEQGSGEMTWVIRLWFAPSHRLFVRTHAESFGEFSGGPAGALDSVATSRLRSLTPA